MQLVDHTTFLTQLTALFESTKDHGSIWLTHKRLTHDGEHAITKHEESNGPDQNEYQCLIRATNGKHVNFSTHVDANELTKFYSAYAILLKSSLSLNLRKRDKKKEKTKQDQILKRKKRMTEPVVVDGPKRGAGRRKRQRQIKAAIKQAEAQKKFKEREEKRKVENLSAQASNQFHRHSMKTPRRQKAHGLVYSDSGKSTYTLWHQSTIDGKK